jgi:serralysin
MPATSSTRPVGPVDKVFSSVTYSLANAARVKGAVENLTLTGAGNVHATGNALANVLVGNAGGNRIEAGAGKDTQTGGGGNDLFVFRKGTDSGLGKKADVITDFDDAGNDRIDFSIFKGTYSYIHDAAFSGARQVRIEDVAGADVVVQVNTGGSLAADIEIRLSATTLASMTASDFIL